jgi:hypothetical protein
MTRKGFWVGVCLSAAIALWGTAGQVFAGPKAGHTNHGKAHTQQAARGNGRSSGSVTATGGASASTSSGSSSASTSSGSSSASTSSGSSPVGNNGTVKIDNFTDRNGNDIAHNNEPHVSCAWGVDAYGYEFSAPIGTESFLQHSPTPGFGTHASAQRMALENVHPRGTGATYNGSTTNSLVLVGTPHPKQGYHVRLTYTAPDGNSNGSTVKHKVFWVQPCGATTTGGGGGGGGVSGGALAMRAAATAASTARPGTAVTAQPGFTG